MLKLVTKREWDDLMLKIEALSDRINCLNGRHKWKLSTLYENHPTTFCQYCYKSYNPTETK